ncbi:hypothetical protein [Streptomyces sp. NPDC059819]|uniref:hypothetical protein n=1 Tax=Streptomyces sp. NPDC059819 TaxID=3346963 RepID=UPI003658D354
MTSPASPPPHSLQGLSRRAQLFVRGHGLRVPPREIQPRRVQWLRHGIAAAEIDRVADFQERWGGLALPPAPAYEGGPRTLNADAPQGSPAEGWWFSAGDERVSMAYGFMIGPGGEFGIHAERWTPLHASTDGWVESLALAHHAARWAKNLTKITGDAVDALDLDEYEPVPEVQGLTDNWWRGTDSLIAVYRGEADCPTAPRCREAHIYGGLDG